MFPSRSFKSPSATERGMPKFWSPWACLCGTGGTGYDDAAAENQYDLHMAGHWPAYIEPVPGAMPFEWKGKTLWSTR